MRAIIFAVLLAVSVPSYAQSAAQWSQLIEYVKKLANREIDDRATIEKLTNHNKALDLYLRDWVCKWNNLHQNLAAATAQEPTKPIVVIQDKACDGVSAPPPYPIP